MPLALSTGHEVGLALVAGTFIAFAFLSALVIPRWRPDFPGHRLGWFIAGTLVLFVATLAAVEIFAKEPKEAKAGEAANETPGMTIPKAKPPPAVTGDPAAGKAVFAAQGCASCHTFSAAAGATGTIGPDLDKFLKGKDAAFVKTSIIDPSAYVEKGYSDVMPKTFGKTLSAKQIDDLVAFLTQS